MSDTYLNKNAAYWQQGYDAPHVENFVFRTYGRILKPEFGLSGEQHERVLDFGCGQGANLTFFHGRGFDAYGVDISVPDIEHCRQRMPEIQDHFQVIDPKPRADQVFCGGNFDLIMAVQSLYYLGNSDLDVCLESLYRQLKPGGLIFATMMGTRCYYYEHSRPAEDGLREVVFPAEHRLNVSDYFVRFTESAQDLEKIFHRFQKRHIGYYDTWLREDEGSEFHYIYIGQKPLELS